MFVKRKLCKKLIVCCLSVSSFFVSANDIDIERESNELMKSGIAGFSMAIVDEDGLIMSKGYGFADVVNNIPMSDNTIQNIGSISKTITGAAAMLLVEQGKLDLDKDINSYLPFSVKHPAFLQRPITTRQLLTHTSSILDRDSVYNGDLSYHYGGDNPVKLGDFLKEYFTPKEAIYSVENFASYAPGTQRKYSNIAYGLVGHIVENISIMSFNEFTKKHIFDRVGMNSTGWMYSEINQENHAQVYKYQANKLNPIGKYGLVTWPDGGLRTSVTDLSKFMTMMMNEGRHNAIEIFKAETVQAIFTPQFSKKGVLSQVKENDDYKQAITWNIIQRKSGGKVIGHTGGDPGIRTYAYFDPNTHRGMLLFLNTSSRDEVIGKAVSKYIQSLLTHMNQVDRNKLTLAKLAR